MRGAKGRRRKGLVIVNTGNGKGKTTAAMFWVRRLQRLSYLLRASASYIAGMGRLSARTVVHLDSISTSLRCSIWRLRLRAL